jgi:hypothetical protein
MRIRSFINCGVVLAALLFLSGCVDKTVKGQTSVYSFAPWVVMLVLVLGMAGIPFGWMMRKTSVRLLLLGLIGGPVLLLIFLPGVLLDKCKVDAQHFEGRYGIWLSPTQYNIRFADLDHIDVVTYETRGRRGRKTTKQRLECVDKRGRTTTLQVNDLLKAAGGEIIEKADAAGVKIEDRDERP